jgi:hypothetical protein
VSFYLIFKPSRDQFLKLSIVFETALKKVFYRPFGKFVKINPVSKELKKIPRSAENIDRYVMEKNKRILFPFGFFSAALVIFETITCAAAALVFILLAKQDIRSVENDARSYIAPLVDLCAANASMGTDTEITKSLTPLFTEYQQKGFVYRAFFVKENGAILAHSNSYENEMLRHNIARDEFTYNLDQIFLPLKNNETNSYFSDYFIPEIKSPFRKKEITYIKKYLYPEIDKNGWLVSKAVFRDGKPFGVAAFILEKSEISRLILLRYEQFLFWVKRGAATAAAVSLFLSFLMLFRYSSLVKRGMLLNTEKPLEISPKTIVPPADQSEIKKVISKPEKIYIEDETRNKITNKIILDAIPIGSKREDK